MFSIKNAAIADIALIRELAFEVWPQTYSPVLGPQQVAYMLDLFYTPSALQKQMEEAGHQFILCFIDEDPVAFASWSETEPHIYKLHKIYILPHLQGIGVGKLMMGYIVNELRKKGATFLRLNVNRYNTSAITFYNKSGFEHFGDEDIDIGNGYFMNDHVLSLRIL